MFSLRVGLSVGVSWLTSGRFIAPVIEELSKQYPDVTTYKIDIDEVCMSIFNWVSVKLFMEHECVTMCSSLLYIHPPTLFAIGVSE